MWAGVLGTLTLVVSAISFEVVKVAPLQRLGVGFEFARISRSYHLPTEASDVFLGIWEHVKIPHPTPNIEKSAPGDNVFDVRDGQRWHAQIRPCPTHRIAVWPQQTSARRDARDVKIETHGKWRGSQFPIDMQAEVSSWSIPGVVPDRSKPPMIFSLFGAKLKQGLETGSEHESSFVRDKGALCDNRCVLRRFGGNSRIDERSNHKRDADNADLQLEERDIDRIFAGVGRPKLSEQAVVGASLGLCSLALGYLLYSLAAILYPLKRQPPVDARKSKRHGYDDGD